MHFDLLPCTIPLTLVERGPSLTGAATECLGIVLFQINIPANSHLTPTCQPLKASACGPGARVFPQATCIWRPGPVQPDSSSLPAACTFLPVKDAHARQSLAAVNLQTGVQEDALEGLGHRTLV